MAGRRGQMEKVKRSRRKRGGTMASENLQGFNFDIGIKVEGSFATGKRHKNLPAMRIVLAQV